MKRALLNSYTALFLIIILISLTLSDCKKVENPIKFPRGTFPDTVKNMSAINSIYDDYNVSLNKIYGDAPIIFSSNRRSQGGQFDLEQALITFEFDKTDGAFGLVEQMLNNDFLSKLIAYAETPGDDFGPFRLWAPWDGFEYMLLSSENEAGDLDFFYLKNRPVYDSGQLPDVEGPFPVTLFNTDSNDAYLCMDTDLDTAYFSSEISGDFDIYLHERPKGISLTEWFNLDYSASTSIDNVNSSSDDKCPIVFYRTMIFASDRPGGLGGFDLYYSVLSDGSWGTPVNFGPGINTSSDEYRPVIGYHPEFTNLFMMFSSNRPGGKGGFDLYFTGID